MYFDAHRGQLYRLHIDRKQQLKPAQREYQYRLCNKLELSLTGTNGDVLASGNELEYRRKKQLDRKHAIQRESKFKYADEFEDERQYESVRSSNKGKT